jgi:hypothetical protein
MKVYQDEAMLRWNSAQDVAFHVTMAPMLAGWKKYETFWFVNWSSTEWALFVLELVSNKETTPTGQQIIPQ